MTPSPVHNAAIPDCSSVACREGPLIHKHAPEMSKGVCLWISPWIGACGRRKFILISLLATAAVLLTFFRVYSYALEEISLRTYYPARPSDEQVKVMKQHFRKLFTKTPGKGTGSASEKLKNETQEQMRIQRNGDGAGLHIGERRYPARAQYALALHDTTDATPSYGTTLSVATRVGHEVHYNLSGPTNPHHIPIPRGFPKIILLWNSLYGHSDFTFGLGQRGFEEWNCPVRNCFLSDDRVHSWRADAVVFNFNFQLMLRWGKGPPPRRKTNQRYVFFSQESPYDTPKGLYNYDGQFDLTMTYRLDSDIVVPYGSLERREETLKNASLSASGMLAKRGHVAWVISHCNKQYSQRNAYVLELKKHVSVDVYGDCGRPCPQHGLGCFAWIAKRYKFYLAIENAVCTDYATEKLFRTLNYDIVPVVLGGFQYARHLPRLSYINGRNFKSPKKLAAHLSYLDKNDHAYLRYFDWKRRYHVHGSTYMRAQGFCKLCEILHDPEYHFRPPNFSAHNWWTVGHCSAPKDISPG